MQRYTKNILKWQKFNLKHAHFQTENTAFIWVEGVKALLRLIEEGA